MRPARVILCMLLAFLHTYYIYLYASDQMLTSITVIRRLRKRNRLFFFLVLFLQMLGYNTIFHELCIRKILRFLDVILDLHKENLKIFRRHLRANESLSLWVVSWVFGRLSRWAMNILKFRITLKVWSKNNMFPEEAWLST